MQRGRLVRSGTVHDLVGTTGSAYVEVDDRARARDVLAQLPDVVSVRVQGDGLVVEQSRGARAELTAALVAAGLRVDTVMATQRLEDAFLELLDADDRATEVRQT